MSDFDAIHAAEALPEEGALPPGLAGEYARIMRGLKRSAQAPAHALARAYGIAAQRPSAFYRVGLTPLLGVRRNGNRLHGSFEVDGMDLAFELEPMAAGFEVRGRLHAGCAIQAEVAGQEIALDGDGYFQAIVPHLPAVLVVTQGANEYVLELSPDA